MNPTLRARPARMVAPLLAMMLTAAILRVGYIRCGGGRRE